MALPLFPVMVVLLIMTFLIPSLTKIELVDWVINEFRKVLKWMVSSWRGKK